MSRFGIGMLTLGAFGVAALVACADAEESGEPPRDVPEGGTLPNVDSSAPAPDAAVDPHTDAGEDVDAAPRVCSKEGFCHTTLPPKQSLRGVWADGTGVAWAVTEEGNILRFDGTTWKVHATTKGPLASIWGSGPTDVWVGTSNGLMHGTGATSAALVFTDVATPDPVTPITSIWGTGPNDVWAVGGELTFPLKGRVLHYAGKPDAGAGDAGGKGEPSDWTLENITKEPYLYMRVFGTPASGVWLAGRRNNPKQFWFEVALLHRPANGTDWEDVPLPTDPDVGNNPVGTFEHLWDAAMSADGQSVFLLGRTHSARPAYARGTAVNGGQSWAWSYNKDGVFGEPTSHAIAAGSATDVWIAGDYGRLKHLSGATWKQSLITVDKFPVIDPFYAIGGKGNDMWFVGDDIALHRDPAKAQP